MKDNVNVKELKDALENALIAMEKFGVKTEKRGRPKSNKEIKENRQQFVFTKSLADEMAARAAALKLSKNEYIERLIKYDLNNRIL